MAAVPSRTLLLALALVAAAHATLLVVRQSDAGVATVQLLSLANGTVLATSSLSWSFRFPLVETTYGACAFAPAACRVVGADACFPPTFNVDREPDCRALRPWLPLLPSHRALARG